MQQLELPLPNPPQVDLDGHIDEKTGISYIGMATRQFDGSYHALANINGALCLVQLTLTEAQQRNARR